VRRERAVQVLPFAALAFALLLLEGLPAARAPRSGRRAAAAAALLLLAAGPLTREAALRLQRAGLEKLERGDTGGAQRALAAAALATRDAALAALAYYHLGVAHLAAGELEGARLAFFDALALDPEDAMARFDLEWTLAASRRPPRSARRRERRAKRSCHGPPWKTTRRTQPAPGAPKPPAPLASAPRSASAARPRAGRSAARCASPPAARRLVRRPGLVTRGRVRR
jgi:tetratricopeptide (TPR) repeat protein